MDHYCHSDQGGACNICEDRKRIADLEAELKEEIREHEQTLATQRITREDRDRLQRENARLLKIIEKCQEHF
jgi:septal ring factor EnvC (AmiA/AmiB activator)